MNIVPQAVSSPKIQGNLNLGAFLFIMENMNIAVLIDGGFFLNRYRVLYRDGSFSDPQKVAKRLHAMAYQHMNEKNNRISNDLYRIFYYDAYPFTKKIHNPITRKLIDFSKTDQAIFRLSLFEELKKKRKVALRLGYLKDSNEWNIRPRIVKDLLNNKISISNLTEEDITYSLRQKVVDIKIGLDIASLAYKKLVQRIILISGDSDFVPAAKVARREGIDFILDPMWNPIDPDLHEHIDGLKSVCPKPGTCSVSTINGNNVAKEATPI